METTGASEADQQGASVASFVPAIVAAVVAAVIAAIVIWRRRRHLADWG
ncbi:MAG: hypothetical protein J6S63_06400 [Atopobiaceae bacterium]|nr:hypothetical protein [Atopobiaceae bacterium]